MTRPHPHSKQYTDALVGKKIGELLVIRRLKDRNKGAKNVRAVVLCECSCGKRLEIPRYYMLRENPKTHCGCKNASSLVNKFPGEYSCWTMMKTRCYDENHVSYKDYGGRGIRVSAHWLASFETFLEDMGTRPTPHHTLDRKEVNGNYGKDNCRWATGKEQAANKRNNQPQTQLGDPVDDDRNDTPPDNPGSN